MTQEFQGKENSKEDKDLDAKQRFKKVLEKKQSQTKSAPGKKSEKVEVRSGQSNKRSQRLFRRKAGSS